MKQTLIAFDQLVNTLVWAKGEGFGMADETISARSWRLRKKPFWGALRVLVDSLFFWQPNHCADSYMSEQARKHLPGVYSSAQ